MDRAAHIAICLIKLSALLLTAGVELSFKRSSERLHSDLALKWRIIMCAKRYRKSNQTLIWYRWRRSACLEEWTQVHSFCKAITDCFLEAQRGRAISWSRRNCYWDPRKSGHHKPPERQEKLPIHLGWKKCQSKKRLHDWRTMVKTLCQCRMDSVFSFLWYIRKGVF